MKTTQIKRTVYDIVTDRIVEHLEHGVVPWQKPWRDDCRPKNLITNKAYRGINIWLLMAAGYKSNYFLSFKQANSLGAKIKRGEKSHLIVFWTREEREDRDTKEKKLVSILQYSLVFNIEQCENIPINKIPVIEQVVHNPIEACEAILWSMPKCPEVIPDKSEAYYDPVFDTVNMPPRDSFITNEGYYSTLFHELIHSTGHHSRLFRSELMEQTKIGSHSYSVEELTAEMGACYLCSLTGIGQETFSNSAAYINGWLKRLKSDSRFIIQASVQAQRAVEFILGYPKKETGTTPTKTEANVRRRQI